MTEVEKQLKNDLYYLGLAKKASENNKCLSRHVGAVIVKNGSVISTGRNGPARGVKHCNERSTEFYFEIDKTSQEKIAQFKELWNFKDCPRRNLGYKSGQGLHICQAGHAERNAILQAAKNGISTKDASIYCWCGRPCKDCMIEIVNAGIKEVICLSTDTNSGDYDVYSQKIADDAGLVIRRIERSLF